MPFAVPLTDSAELRPLEPWQAGEFLAHVDKARDALAQYVPWAEVVTDEDRARSYLSRYARRQAADEGRMYGIWLEGELVGGVQLRGFDSDSGTTELGAWMAPEAQGRGLITRAVQRLIDWVIGVRGLNRVEWRCTSDNTRSAATARRLGMVYEGTLRQAFVHHGEVHDVQVWAMTRGDWEQRPWG
ncbi:GNAT family protein [Kribbella sp. NPDC026611]|uniref:GNAT family N-acetyltransferase n=1 Tax=Kribbella sp. NPDC026611 TaxID=3154911 RepID=UPI0033CD58F3